MAYAAVASLSHTIDLLLDYHQPSISPQFKNLIIALHKHALSLQSLLEDSPRRPNSWEEQIREVANKAEDIIELLLSDSLLLSVVGSANPRLEFELGKYELPYGFIELEKATEEIESIVKRIKGRHDAALDDSNNELIKTVSRLRGGSSALEIISIFGMGGIGKTTLARKAYNDPSIKEHFEIQAWSAITRDSVRRVMILELLRSVINSNTGSASSSNSEEELMESVCKILRGRRYLIVFDDMLSLAAFEGLKSMLPDDGNGSRIILTTRLHDVAMAATHVHKMCFLDEDRAWDLLRRKVFKRDHCPSHLEPFGRMIARSCRGHPLSIEVVSGMLAVDHTEAAWEDISENMNIASENAVRRLSEVLSLGYTHLPRHLRPCYLYFGIFPEDHEIYVSKLVKLWAAEGFLDESESESFEKTGEKHVRDVVRRNLVSVVKRKSNGRIKSIRMRDVMWDFCLGQSYVDNFIFRAGRFCSFDPDLELEAVDLVLDCRLKMLRLLRILDLSDAYNVHLPEQVYMLFHLRYLAIDCRSSILRTISRLENLQTLIICPRRMYAMFGELPNTIWDLPQLRHLAMFLFELPTKSSIPMYVLKNLQTLSRVADFVCSRFNLSRIPNMIKLALFYSNKFRVTVDDIELHNLISMEKLEILKIEMDWISTVQSNLRICFPWTLKKLSLSGVGLPWEAMKIVASLPKLQVLKLRKHACIGKTWETSEGGFSHLTFLLIETSYGLLKAATSQNSRT